MIRAENIHIEYDKVLLDNESIMAPSSCVTLIKGESGSGKSALLYRLGLLKNDCDIYINDEYIHQTKSINDMRRNRIGFVFQNNEIIDHLDVKQNLIHYALMAGYKVNNEKLLQILQTVKLDVPFNQSVSTLSLGQKQRLAIGCALIKDPDIFILDEPTASLDKENEIIIFEICQKLAHKMDKTVILSSHSIIADNYADNIYMIENHHLILIKEANNTIIDSIKENKNIHPLFFKTYCQDTFHKFKMKYGLLSIIIFSIIVLSLFSITFVNHLLESNKNIIYDQYDKLLYITKDKDSKYPSDNNTLYHYEELQSYEHPFIKIYLSEDSKVQIIPYFDSQNFNDKLDSNNHISQYTNGIYISHEAYQSLRMNYPSVSNDMTLNFEILKEDGYMTQSVDITILGTLKTGIYDTYNNNSNYYIYMYYKDIENLYDDDSYIGLVVECQSYEDFKEKKEYYVELGYTVNDDTINDKTIDEVVDYYTMIEIGMVIILSVIGIIATVLMNIYLFFQRRKELTLLMINGLKDTDFIKLFTNEYKSEIKYIFPLSIIINFVVLTIYHSNYLLLLLNIIDIILIYFITMLVYTVLIRNINIEKVLRS